MYHLCACVPESRRQSLSLCNGDGQIGFRTYSVHQCKFDDDCYGDGQGDGTCKRTFTVRVNEVYSAIHKAAGRAIPSFAWYNSCGTEKIP